MVNNLSGFENLVYTIVFSGVFIKNSDKLIQEYIYNIEEKMHMKKNLMQKKFKMIVNETERLLHQIEVDFYFLFGITFEYLFSPKIKKGKFFH